MTKTCSKVLCSLEIIITLTLLQRFWHFGPKSRYPHVQYCCIYHFLKPSVTLRCLVHTSLTTQNDIKLQCNFVSYTIAPMYRLAFMDIWQQVIHVSNHSAVFFNSCILYPAVCGAFSVCSSGDFTGLFACDLFLSNDTSTKAKVFLNSTWWSASGDKLFYSALRGSIMTYHLECLICFCFVL